MRSAGASMIVLPAFLLFAAGMLTDLRLPGIYMDAVNPDYAVLRLTAPHPLDILVAIPPGNMLLRRLPVLGQIYHGALPFYLGLPAYLSAGTGVIGIRLANLGFGLVVLAGSGFFMRAFGARPLICALCLASLATDPGFLFSFRTQVYITLLPVGFLLSSAALLAARRDRLSLGLLGLSGLLAGIACYGYFIYAFCVPAVALYAGCVSFPALGARTTVRWWGGGLALGIAPYAAGFLLIAMATGGLAGLQTYLHGVLDVLHPQSSGLPTTGRAGLFLYFAHQTLIGTGPAAMMFNRALPPWDAAAKIALLAALPAAALASTAARPAGTGGLGLLAGIVAGLFILVMAFGDRLWLHHFALLLPVLYAALALGLEHFAAWLLPVRPRAAAAAAILLLLPILAGNASQAGAFFAVLETTRGVGLSSDAVNRYAEASRTDVPDATRFFPDWGLQFPFLMLTGGASPTVPGFDPARARAILCAGHDVEVATLRNRSTPLLPQWAAAVGWPRAETLHYDQADGAPLITIMRWRAADRPPRACQ